MGEVTEGHTSMIAELFYPKELKDIIADLRAKDDLNEKPLKSLYWVVDFIYFPLFLISISNIYFEHVNPNIGIELPIFFSTGMPFIIGSM